MAVSVLAERIEYTLVSGPDGPLTRRYAPTSGKPSSGPLRPRTEALSGIGDIYQSVTAYAGLRRFYSSII